MGAKDIAEPDYQLGRGLPRRPARRPVHGPRLRPGLPRRSGPRPDDAPEHPEVQHADGLLRPLQLPALVRPGRRDGAPHGQLPERPAAQSLPVFHRGHDRLRIHGRGRADLRGRCRKRARGHPERPRPLRRQKRSPFDEAECGHHYARAMASWAAVPALSGFAWDGVAKAMSFMAGEGTWFWSNGDAWGTCRIGAGAKSAELAVLHGSLPLGSFSLGGAPARNLRKPASLEAGGTIKLEF
ncbi:MAG: hypothetical protein M0C28_25145 [Candidatus Moduliflexus flocculans]|nr:hypothetical protein [Candidatus Moduliflexus flocculans]